MRGFIYSLPSDIIFNKGIIPLMHSIVNEPKNMGAKKLNKYIFADAGLNVIGQKIIKVIKSSEKRRILWKEITTKITSQEGGFLIFLLCH